MAEENGHSMALHIRPLSGRLSACANELPSTEVQSGDLGLCVLIKRCYFQDVCDKNVPLLSTLFCSSEMSFRIVRNSEEL